jgi:protoporphyrinogen oxidase
MSRIAVIGAGITGLSLAAELCGRHQVDVYEQHSRPGGLAGCVPFAGVALEAFYHHFFTTDSALLGLIDDLGLRGRVLELPSSVGIHYPEGNLPFSAPLDLLRFPRLGWASRLAFGLHVLHLRRTKSWKTLEQVTVREWMQRHGGAAVYDQIWEPLLQAKFGAHAGEISMAWLWGRINPRAASRDRKGEKLCYLRGGMEVLFNALDERIKARGGRVLYRRPVKEIVVEGNRTLVASEGGEAAEHDLAVLTVDCPTALRIVPQAGSEARARMEGVEYFGALCLLLSLERRLGDIYWMNNADPDLPVSGVIEHTNLVPPEEYNGRHVAYVFRYLSPEAPLFRAPDEDVRGLFLEALGRVHPSFRREQVVESRLFRSGTATPLYKGRYSQGMPPTEIVPGRVFLANTAQIYPQDRNLNNGILLAAGLAGSLQESGALGRAGQD